MVLPSLNQSMLATRRREDGLSGISRCNGGGRIGEGVACVGDKRLAFIIYGQLELFAATFETTEVILPGAECEAWGRELG